MKSVVRKEKVTYTKEELAEKVKVPAVVEQDLKRIISDRLEQCGMYFRVFSRTKTAASMEQKFKLKEYGEDRKLQDLVGCRINLYFDDDVDICRSIMEKTFEAIEWSTSERSDEEFKPTKLNGVFRLPEYLRSEISPATWDMSIDDTFEIQIKTMFFEGWHEIEHDMRYKGEDLWREHPGFSRYFNSILATLELCDKSMVTLFEDLGHELYKSGYWSDMIRSHFRLKIGDTQLYPEVQQRLTEDQRLTVDSLAKRIYKTSKPALVELLVNRSRKIPINVNTIVAILNDAILHDQRLSEIFRARDVYNDGREESVGESRHYELKPLVDHNVFHIRTEVDGSRLRIPEHPTDRDIFERSSWLIYSWSVQKYGVLLPNMPENIGNYQGSIPGYHAAVSYEPDKLRMDMEVRHIDLEVGGRIWFSRAKLWRDELGRIILECTNGYCESISEHFVQETDATFFSYPGYYKLIVDSIGVFNGAPCQSRRRIITDEQRPTLEKALRDPERVFPIILISSKKQQDGLMDESWLGQFRVSDFTRTVWRYAHVFTCYEEIGSSILKDLDMPEDMRRADGRMYIFWPDGDTDVYGPEDVTNCSFGRHLEVRDDARTYDIVHGGQAFYHKIVTDLREYNVAAGAV